MAGKPKTQTLDGVSPRLSARQREALEYALDGAQLSEGSKVYLFGSRTDPNAKGGDVDLLVCAPDCDPYSLSRTVRRLYQRKLDERIDVVVIDTNRPDPAMNTLLATAQKVLVR